MAALLCFSGCRDCDMNLAYSFTSLLGRSVAGGGGPSRFYQLLKYDPRYQAVLMHSHAKTLRQCHSHAHNYVQVVNITDASGGEGWAGPRGRWRKGGRCAGGGRAWVAEGLLGKARAGGGEDGIGREGSSGPSNVGLVEWGRVGARAWTAWGRSCMCAVLGGRWKFLERYWSVWFSPVPLYLVRVRV